MSKICVPVKCHIWVQKVGIYHTMRAGVSTVSQFRAFYCGLRNAHKGGTVAYIFVSMTTYTHIYIYIYILWILTNCIEFLERNYKLAGHTMSS